MILRNSIARLFICFLSLIFLTSATFAQNTNSGESSWDSHIGPFSSKFQIPGGWKIGEDAVSKASSLYEREGMTAKINLAMTFGQEGIFIASWQDFEYPIAAEVAQLTNEKPPLPGVKNSDIKMSVETASNAGKFEYAFFRGVGNGDNFSISGKGKSRYTGYWVHMPIQYKNDKGALLSGMLSIFARVNESQTSKLRIDSVINNFISSLDFESQFHKISFDAHKKEVVESLLRKKIEAEMAQSANKNGKAETATAPPAASIPAIKEIYMVDAEGNCFKFGDKSGFAPITCPTHKSK